MKKEQVVYSHGNVQMHGEFILPEGEQPHPLILVAHAWRGVDAFVRSKAQEIVVSLGIGAFVCDLYGRTDPVDTDEEAGQLMMPLFKNRKELRARISAAYQCVTSHPLVDATRIGAIGFCFGGLAVIELFRSGLPVKGVLAFHPVLGDQLMDQKAAVEPIAKGISGSILALIGHLDPLVTQEDIQKFEVEMSKAGVDWQIHIYGKAYHSFTNPNARDKSQGLIFDPLASRRAWQTMGIFFTSLM